jgi:hydroxymethylbilane synthase
MARPELIIGSRGSRLALWQAEWVKKQLERRHAGLTVRIEVIKTTGDKVLDSPLSRIGGRGVFVKEIENALLKGKIDLAVHSLKDVPTEVPGELTLGAVTKREDCRDCVVGKKKLKSLPKGAMIGTSSLRRRAQLMAARPDLRFTDLRGNLDTRLRKMDEGGCDAMVLARAGLKRLGFVTRIAEVLPYRIMLPAVGQGALAVEVRKSDRKTKELVRFLDHPATRIAVTAERALLRELEGGCQVPIGALGRVRGNQLVLEGLIASLEGKRLLRGRMEGDVEKAESVGKRLARTLLKAGGDEILKEVRALADNRLTLRSAGEV